MPEALPAWVSEPALDPLWSAVRGRLQRNGVEPRGVVVVTGLDRAGRHAVGGLLGRPVLRDRVRVDLAELDDLLVARAGAGLVGVVTLRTGPLLDRVGLRSERDAARQAPFAAVQEWLAVRSDANRAWTQEWLASIRAAGVLSRVADPATASRVLVQAAEVAAALTTDGPAAGLARNELAARHTGDAHALDDGSLCGALVLRALASAAEQAWPRTPAERRRLWEAFGVESDSVSSSVLTLGLRPVADGALARRLRSAADSGDPVHVTAWDLRRGEVGVPAVTAVLVCENPRVLEAAAAQHGGRYPVVCTAGMPAVVALSLLQQLARGGAVLRYHGDFDWPGIAIANRLVELVGCSPWLMSAAEYVAAVRAEGVALSGAPTAPSWDPALGEAMQRTGLAVHEEAVLDVLLHLLAQLPAEA